MTVNPLENVESTSAADGREILHLNTGTIIFREGDPSNCAYKIESGGVEIIKTLGGVEISVATLRTGEVFGDMGLVELEPRSATIRTIVPTVLQVLPAVLFQEGLAATPPFVRDILARFSKRLRKQTIETANRIQDESEQGLLDVIEASPVAVGITDHNGKFLYWNRQFFQMGRHHVDASGTSRFGLVFSKEELHQTLLDRIHSGEKIVKEDAELLLSNTEKAYVSITMQKMEFENQPAVLIWVYDVTALKLQEVALNLARIEAEKANSAKSEFLATMSHEIRTPMNGVVTMSEILDQTDLTSGQRAMTTIIRDSATALLSIIDDVLDFSKIEAGKLQIEHISLSLRDILEAVADLLAPRASEKGLDLITYVDPVTPDHLVGDPVRLRQILLNLIGNALKFTGSGHVFIQVESTSPDPDHTELLFRIADTGIGITPEQKAQLFMPFVQADGSTKRRFGGTGLGLSICKTLVGLMGGELGVDSVLGEGSTFWFRLGFPIKAERRQLIANNLSGVSVVVVAKSPERAHVVDCYLSHRGATVTTTRTGGAALALMRQQVGFNQPLDVAIVDSDLGDMDGLAFARTIATENALSHTKTLLLLPRMLIFSFLETKHDEVFATVDTPLRYGVLCQAVAAAVGQTIRSDEKQPARRTRDSLSRKSYTAPSREEAITNNSVILLAEDNPTNQTVIRMLLERLGFVADVANNGVEALRMLNEKPYGLLLTDCHMPEMDGYQLSRCVREEELERAGGTPPLPIVALTADALSGTAEKCTDAGMNAYLTKPVSWVELDRTIEAWLPRAAALRQMRIESPDSEVVEPDSTREPEVSPPQPDQNEAPVLDPSLLLELVGGETEMVRPMLDMYVETTEPLIEELFAALAVDNFDVMRKKAHSCAGASKTAGAMVVGNLFSAIEKAVVTGDFTAARADAGKITAAFAEAKEAIRDVT